MKIKITENKRNEMFKRQDILGEVEEEIIPSREEIKKNLAAQLDTDEKKIVVRKIESLYGQKKNIIDARAYDDEEKMKEIEKKFVLERNKGKEEETKENSGDKDKSEEAKEEVKTEEEKKE
jgi:ribosomal protein S24E